MTSGLVMTSGCVMTSRRVSHFRDDVRPWFIDVPGSTLRVLEAQLPGLRHRHLRRGLRVAPLHLVRSELLQKVVSVKLDYWGENMREQKTKTNPCFISPASVLSDSPHQNQNNFEQF